MIAGHPLLYIRMLLDFVQLLCDPQKEEPSQEFDKRQPHTQFLNLCIFHILKDLFLL